MPPKPDSSPPRRRRSAGGGWLLLFVVVAAAGAVVFFAGDKVRGMLGIARQPGSEGAEPTVPSDTTANVVEKTPPESAQAAGPVTVAQAAAPTAGAPPAPVTRPTIPNPDQSTADKLLTEAESDYRSFKWDAAKSYADRILTLNCSQPTLTRAHIISDSAPQLADLFTKLDEKDELVRNYDTNPGLVRIDGGSEPLYAVAVASGDAKDPVLVEENAASYITESLKAGPVHAMVLGAKEFIFTTLPDTVATVRPVDQQQVHAQKLAEFNAKLGHMKNSAAARDPLAWYAAGKFAYRNRLDERVTEMLDQALDLDPGLVQSVREEKAGKLCSAMVLHLKSGSKKQAEIYMGIIRRRYSDTDQGRQAALIFEGKMQELVAMAADEDKKRKDADSARQQARIDRAKQEGDEAKAAAIAQEKPATDTDMDTPDPQAPNGAAAPVTGDEATAQKAMDDGMEIYRVAIDMPPTSARNDKYKQASAFFKKAVAMYSALVAKDQNNIDLQTKMVEANKMKFGCEKYLTVDF